MKNGTLFVTGPHLEIGRKWPEIQTLISPEYSLRSPEYSLRSPEYSVWPEILAGHGWSRDRSGFVALGLAAPAPSVTRPCVAWFAGIERKGGRNPRKLGLLAAVATPQSGRPDHRQMEEDRKPSRPPVVRRSPLAGNVAGVARKFSRGFRASVRRAPATSRLEATTNRKRRSSPSQPRWCCRPP